MTCPEPLLLGITGIRGLPTLEPLLKEAHVDLFNYDPGGLIKPKGVQELAQQFLDFALDVVAIKSQIPIICLACDFGGLVLKEALVLASLKSPQYHKLLDSITTLVFFGTPHDETPTETWEKTTFRLLNHLWQPRSDVDERLDEIALTLSIEQKRVAKQFSTMCNRFRLVQYAQDTTSTKLIFEPLLARTGCAFEETIILNVDYEELAKFRAKLHQNKYLHIRKEATIIASPQYRSLIATLELLRTQAVCMTSKENYFDGTASALITQASVHEWLSSDTGAPIALQVPLSLQNDDFLSSVTTSLSELRHDGYQKFLVLTINLVQPACNLYGNFSVPLLSDLLRQALQRNPLFWQDICNIISYDDLVSVFSGPASSLLEPVLWRCFMALLAKNRSIICVMSLGGIEWNQTSWEPVLQRLISVAAGIDCDFRLMFLYTDESPVAYLGPMMESKLDVGDLCFRERIRVDIMRFNTSADGPGLEDLQNHISFAVSDVHGESLRLASFMRYIRTPSPIPELQLVNGLKLLSKQVEILCETLRHVPDSSKVYVRDVLCLAAHSLRPLAISELEDGMRIIASSQNATPPSPQQHLHHEIELCLTILLPSLLRIDHDVVRLVHPDVRHLLNRGQAWYLPQTQPQLTMATLCIQCIASSLASCGTKEQLVSSVRDDKKDTGSSHSSAPRSFLSYAVLNWPFHLIRALSSGSDEVSIQELINLLSDELVAEWLSLKVVLRHPAKTMSSIPSLKLSPLHLVKEYGLSLHYALEVCLQALNTSVALDGKEDIAILWSIAKVIGVEAAAKAWKTDTHRNLCDSRQILECYGLDPSVAFELLVAIDEDYVQSHLNGLICLDICFGGHHVLDYALKQRPASDSTLFQGGNWSFDNSPLQALHMEGFQGLASTDASTRFPSTPLSVIGLAEFLSAAGDKLETILDGAEPEFAFAALYAAVRGGYGRIAETIVRTKVGSDDEAILQCLAFAVGSGFIQALKKLLPHSNLESLNRPVGGARTLLHLATHSAFVRVVAALLDHGAVIDVTDSSGTTPFLEAVELGNLQVVRLLSNKIRHREVAIQHRDGETPESFTAIDTPNDEGVTPLISSLKNGFTAISDIIIEGGGRLDVTDSSGNNLAHLAAEAGLYNLLGKVLKGNAELIDQCNEDKNTPLELAVRNGHADCVSYLLRSGTSGDVTEPIIWAAIYNNYQDVLKALIPSGKDQKTLGESLLRAASSNRPEMCRVLLDSGADKDYQDAAQDTALGLAAYFGYRGIVEIMLLRRANPDVRDCFGRTALWYAARSGFEGICKLLIDAGADVLAEDEDGKTPLDLSQRGNMASFSLLWKSWVATIDPDERETQMTERLEHAVRHGYSELVDQILSHGVKSTPEHLAMAIENLDADIVSRLIDSGASLEGVKISESEVPIHLAAYHCNVKLADVLLVKGKADVNETGGSRWSALYACLDSSKDDDEKKNMLDKLIDFGANLSDTDGPEGSVLHLALSGAPKLARYLIEKFSNKIDLDKGDGEGRVPAHLAASQNNLFVLRSVPGHTLKTPDCQQRLPSHFAAAGGSLNVLRYIVQEQVADVLSEKDIDGWNALHWACRQEDSFVVKWILDWDAANSSSLSMSKTTEPNGWTPLDVAIKHSNDHMLATLSRAMLPRKDETQEVIEADVERPLACWEPVMASCDSCLCSIYGDRYRCLECHDYDLCFKCIKHVKEFHKKHEFRKL